MIIGTGILLVTYLIIVSLLLMLIIAPKLNFWIKCLIIPMVIWFGGALYFIPPTLSGHPTNEEWKNGSILINFLIRENDKSIYLLLIPPMEKNPPLYKKMYPQNMFKGEVVSTKPRLYVMPYNKEDHKKLKEAEEDAKKKKRVVRLYRSKTEEEGNKNEGDGKGKRGNRKEGKNRKNDATGKSWSDENDPGGEIGEWISKDPLPDKDYN